MADRARWWYSGAVAISTSSRTRSARRWSAVAARAWALFLLAGVAHTGCSSDPCGGGDTCINDSTCAATAQCVNGCCEPLGEVPTARASAFPTSVIAGQRVDLNGNESRDNRDPLDELQFAWVLEQGRAVVIEQASQSEAFFIAPDFDGAIRIGLTVTDRDGNSDRDSVEVQVTTCTTTQCSTAGDCQAGESCDNGCCTPLDPSTVGPEAIATANPPTALIGTPVELDGSMSSDNLTSLADLQFSWTQQMGPEVTITQSDEAKAAFIAPEVSGPLQFGLTVTDADGNSDDATVQVDIEVCNTTTCNETPNCPDNAQCVDGCCEPLVDEDPVAVATATPTATFTGERVDLDGTQSRDNETPAAQLQYQWAQAPGGPSVTIEQADSRLAYFVAPQFDGTLSFNLTVTDEDDNRDTASVSVIVSEVCAPATPGELCAQAMQDCGPLTVTDNCNALRDIPSCGNCESPLTCGGGGMENVCGCPQTDQALCDDIGAECGMQVAIDVCGELRSLRCGTCPESTTCGGLGDDKKCGGIVQVEAGSSHTCALISDGTVRCWGENEDGRLGYDNTVKIGDDETPASVLAPADLGGPAGAIATGSRQSCAIHADDGTLKCWGFNHRGQLGYGNDTRFVGDGGDVQRLSDVAWVDPGQPVLQVAVGSDFTCVLLQGGVVKCFGEDADGQLGDGNLAVDDLGDEASETLDRIPAITVGGIAKSIGAGNRHVCVLLTTNNVKCWGYGATGSLGYGNPNTVGDDESPADVPDTVRLGGDVAQLVVGGGHNCALLMSGDVRCWGSNSSGQLGNDNTDEDVGDDELPTAIDPVALGVGTVVGLGAGSSHTCARFANGNIKCWGNGGSGRLGYGNPNNLGVPSPNTVPVGGSVLQIDGGGSHTCAVLAGGTVKCWGNHFDGQLGYAEIYGDSPNGEDIGDDETPADVDPVPVIPGVSVSMSGPQ